MSEDINYIIPFSNGSCHRNKSGSGASLITVQLNHWIPFALSDLGLIAALFLQACRSLGTFNANQEGYAELSTEYRLQCIQSTNASLSTSDMQISDATIAKVMIMAADEVSLYDRPPSPETFLGSDDFLFFFYL
jgi:hypothetical protein